MVRGVVTEQNDGAGWYGVGDTGQFIQSRFLDNTSYGLRLSGSQNTLMASQISDNDAPGVLLEGNGVGNKVIGNSFHNNITTNLWLDNSDEAMVVGNEIDGSITGDNAAATVDGIHVGSNSTNAILVGNNLHDHSGEDVDLDGTLAVSIGNVGTNIPTVMTLPTSDPSVAGQWWGELKRSHSVSGVAVEASVDDLLKIIGEQTVQIRLLEALRAAEAPPRPELHPIADAEVGRMREVLNG